jgi:hypothetical protein
MQTDRELWIGVRRGLLLIIAAFDQRYGVNGKGHPYATEDTPTPPPREHPSGSNPGGRLR